MNWLYLKKLKKQNSIGEVENFFRIKFPQDFVEIVKIYNAGMPIPNTIDTSREQGKAFGELLNFNLDSEENIISIYEEMKNKIPENVYPIAMDPGGNFLCYDYREDYDNPKVVRWDHEQKFVIEGDKLIISDHQEESEYYYLDFVANSFAETISQLYGDTIEQTNSWSKFENEDELKTKFSGEDLEQVNRIRRLQGLPPIEK